MTLAVWKFASCDGCQLTLLDCEDELLALADMVTIAHFLEASSAVQPGPYDVSLVEGSVTTSRDAERIRQIREQPRMLVTIGACATAGGIQALRNFGDVAEFASVVYASPAYIDTLATSTPISAHVPVDFELRGCPIDRRQLLEVLTALLVRAQAGHPGCQRVHRVEAPWAHMRDGGRWDPVPRARHTRRVRRAVPRAFARVLRMLRPHGHPQRPGTGQATPDMWHGRGRLEVWAGGGLAVVVDAIHRVPASPGSIHRLTVGQLETAAPQPARTGSACQMRCGSAGSWNSCHAAW
jgi:Ni,Fe-hydrogenase III small subunit